MNTAPAISTIQRLVALRLAAVACDTALAHSNTAHIAMLTAGSDGIASVNDDLRQAAKAAHAKFRSEFQNAMTGDEWHDTYLHAQVWK